MWGVVVVVVAGGGIKNRSHFDIGKKSEKLPSMIIDDAYHRNHQPPELVFCKQVDLLLDPLKSELNWPSVKPSSVGGWQMKGAACVRSGVTPQQKHNLWYLDSPPRKIDHKHTIPQDVF